MEHQDRSKTYEVIPSRVTAIIVALIAYGICGVFVYRIATRQPLFAVHINEILMAVLTGMIGLGMTLILFRPPVSLVLDDRGIRFKNPPIGFFWSDVRKVDVIEQGIEVTVELMVDDLECYLSPLNESQRKKIDYKIDSGIVKIPLVISDSVDRFRNEIDARLITSQNSTSKDREVEVSENAFIFNIRYLASLIPDRLYRVYYIDKIFYLIRIGGEQDRNPLPPRFGSIEFLLAQWFNSGKKTREEIAEIDQLHPEVLLEEHKHNFKVPVREVMQVNIKPHSSLNTHGVHVGLMTLVLTNGKKFQFQFEDTRHMRCAVTNLPAVLGHALKVDVQWDANKKMFVKKLI